MSDFGEERVGVAAFDLGANRSTAFVGNEIGAVEENDVGAAESGERFAKETGREDASAAERIERVEEDDVEIALKLAMLERVVEEENVDVGTRFDERGGDFGAAGAEEMGRRREPEREFARFVVKLLELRELGRKVARGRRRRGGVRRGLGALRDVFRLGVLGGVDASEKVALAFRLVSSTDKSGRLRVLEKIVGEPTDERRFADPAER